MNFLGWIGRQKSGAIAVLVIIAILSPGLGTLLKPFVTHAVFGLLFLAFLRTDYAQTAGLVKNPALVIAATVWTTLLIPILIVFICTVTGLKEHYPEIFLGITLQAIASPITAAPAIAVIIGLDGTLVLVALVASTVLVPFSAPVIVAAFGLELSLSPMAFGVKLFCILAGAAALGAIVRILLGSKLIKARSDEIDGINIALLFIFVCAVMGGLGQDIVDRPLPVLVLTMLAFALFFTLLAVTFAVFKAAGTERAFALAMMASQRNMGLMLAGTSGIVPDLTWLYFAVSQIPLYLSPLLLAPLVKRITNQTVK